MVQKDSQRSKNINKPLDKTLSSKINNYGQQVIFSLA